jgi:carbamoyltransferase
MTDERFVLGVNRTLDASVCLLGSESFLCSTQKERLTRAKHDGGAPGDFRDFYLKRLPALRNQIDVIVECYASDEEIRNLEQHQAELKELLNLADNAPIVQISHHLAHLYSSYFLSPFEHAAVMVVDFQGSYVKDFSENWRAPGPEFNDWLEVSTFYKAGPDEIVCLDKQIWDGNRRRPVGLGCFYNYLTTTVFPGLGNEGKMMGLAPYGDPTRLRLPPLIVDGPDVTIPDEWFGVLRNRDRFGHFWNKQGSFEECADLAAAGQKCFEDALLKLVDWLYEQTKVENLCFAGGTALNCVANGRLLRESKFKNVFVPPSPHDGGTALGCAVYGMRERLGVRRDLRWVNDFTGAEPCLSGLEVMVRNEGLELEQPAEIIEVMVDLLERGEVVALFQGKSELGPRALGHRSILADPRDPEIKSRINKYIKGREWFRPLAPAALEETAGRYFVIDRPVQFMQFAVDVRDEWRSLLPGITHTDGTARLQTVSLADDHFFHSLLKAFEARTGIGVLLNTSFNTKNEPIVETYAEAIHSFIGTDIDALAIPPFLIRKPAQA